MFPDGPNPVQVQFLPPYKRAGSTTPLVLLHDGGGTTFSYFILGKLNREVWALHNPKYWDAGKWAGGMDEMSRHYIELIKGAGLKGPILLGGWSLGGYLSLTIARMLADDPSSGLSVAGLLIIDSPRHIPRSQIRDKTVKPELSGLPDLVSRSFDNCDEMLETWELPGWDAPANGDGKGGTAVAVGGRAFTIPPGSVLRKEVGKGWGLQAAKRFEFKDEPADPKAPPPAVMVRCTLAAKKTSESQGSSNPCTVDLFRDEPLLGWEGAYPDFIVAVVDVEADHYNVFDKFDNTKMNHLTNQLLAGLEILDSIRDPAKVAAVNYV